MEPRPKGKVTPPPSNSVRMDRDKLSDLFDELDRRNPQGSSDPRRTHVRWPFRQTAIQLKVCHLGGSQATFHVACRNISSGGMSVLHSSFMHSGTRVVASLPHVSGHNIDVDGTITRCTHVQGVCHEVGIKFLQPIDARNFVRTDSMEDASILEKVNPETLEGTVVALVDSESDATQVQHFLRDTRVKLRLVRSFEEVESQFDGTVDVLLADHVVKGKPTASFLAELRQKGHLMPLLVLIGDARPESRQPFAGSEVHSFVIKPFDQTTLLRSLAEFVSADRDVGATLTSLPRNHPHTPKLDRFVKDTNSHAETLERTIETQNFEDARRIVLSIAEASPSMGFHKLAQIAQSADRVLSSTMSVEEAAPRLRQLAKVCRGVRRKAA